MYGRGFKDDFMTEAPNCTKCGKQIVGGAYTYSGRSYHDTCITCSGCSVSLAGLPVVPKDDSFYCGNCAKASAASPTKYSEKCVGCLKPISGKHLNVNNHKYHSECFVCAKCYKPFDGEYSEHEGKPYHGHCVPRILASRTVTTTTTGNYKKGFTVDPITGKKRYANGTEFPDP